ncbi:homeobox-containing protein 1-like isoform X3 [Xyrauchen texanus]|uniref:homeobox-containing protein 1-like isoform X3 n=1 Tax=Xyrauchen texanus TaxID=154827 RepID=UPI002242AC8C|nr:homeobox-containing protein 1-like isoform X3 [Xyrauchen texanus]
MSHYTDEPRFTIEQIDLLQRLRRTSMTKPEILHALDTLERLDREHGDKFGGHGPLDSSTTNSTTSGTTPTSNNTNKATTATQTQFGNLSPSPSNSYGTSPPTVLPSPVALVAMAQNGRDTLAATPNGKLSPNRYPMNSAAAVRSYGMEGSEDDLDVDDKVEELMRRDSTLVKEEIKAFLGNRRISQAVVAQVTGISQSRISHWLLQQGSDLSEQKKRAFYRWYQLEKTTPGATLNMRAAPISVDEMEWRQTPPPICSTPGSFRLRRGSRFTWRKECLAVMESYFSDNQYPDEAKREEIANACNAVIQKPGKKLSDLERVTSLKVYNWFANRRKEIKRRANIATILENHGIDVQSPGGHSNSDDIDANDYNEQGCDVSYFEKRGVNRPFGYYRLEPTSPTQEDGANHVDQQDPISLAVEMAAVNHSILALSHPGGVACEIKTEALDDD